MGPNGLCSGKGGELKKLIPEQPDKNIKFFLWLESSIS